MTREAPPSPRTDARPIRVGLLLFQDFSMMVFAAVSEPLRATNRLAGTTRYEWVAISPTGGPVRSSSGIPIPTVAIADCPDPDRLIVIASLGIESLRERRANAYLQRLAARGKPLGAVSNGTFLLARAGLLTGYRCTLHWENLRQFAEEFPEISVCREIYVRDRNRWTCAGGTAAIDLMLDQISLDCGPQLAVAVAEQFLHNRIRAPGEHQRAEVQWRHGVRDTRLVAAILRMEEHVEDILEIADIAAQADLSVRQLERLWQRELGTTPQRFYLDLRLREARRLLRESDESVTAISVRCGFASASHLSTAFGKLFGHSPVAERRRRDGTGMA